MELVVAQNERDVVVELIRVWVLRLAGSDQMLRKGLW